MSCKNEGRPLLGSTSQTTLLSCLSEYKEIELDCREISISTSVCHWQNYINMESCVSSHRVRLTFNASISSRAAGPTGPSNVRVDADGVLATTCCCTRLRSKRCVSFRCRFRSAITSASAFESCCCAKSISWAYAVLTNSISTASPLKAARR